MLKLTLFLAGLAIASAAQDVCGTRPAISNDVTTFIVGGTPAERGAWPWQVSIRKNYLIGDGSFHTCGGTLIDEQWVLTAAHCFDSRNMKKENYQLVLGNHLQELGDDSTEQIVTIENVIIHESYNSRTAQNDIALLKLNAAVAFNDYIQPACLPLPSKDYPAGTYVFITGWGDQEKTPFDDTLQQIEVPIIDTNKCNETDWYNGRVYRDSMFCAGIDTGGQDSCQGDSGGPVVVDEEKDGVFEVIGITSWGYGCADAQKPGVYTRVPTYVEWINDIMGSQ